MSKLISWRTCHGLSLVISPLCVRVISLRRRFCVNRHECDSIKEKSYLHPLSGSPKEKGTSKLCLFQNYVIVFHCSFIIIAMTVSRMSLNINSLRNNNNRMAILQWISHLSLGFVCIMENEATSSESFMHDALNLNQPSISYSPIRKKMA